MPRAVIVGESNPFGGDDYFAMYPEPAGCAGDRLCRLVMGLHRRTYLLSFERRNLLRGDRWSAPRAREAAAALSRQIGEGCWILLGRRVAEAFGHRGNWSAPYVCHNRLQDVSPASWVWRGTAALLPHPSGRNRLWSDPALAERCRALLQQVLPEIPFGEALAPQEK